MPRACTKQTLTAPGRKLTWPQVIGAGASSQVKKAVDLRDNRFVALKVMSVLDSSKARQLLNEARDLSARRRIGP